MAGIGKLLRQAREEQQLSLAEIESEIKIRRRYLEALETEEYEILPGSVYMYGFLRNYASFLGLDADQIVSQLKSQCQLNEDPGVDVKPLRSSSHTPKTISLGRLLKILAVLLAITLVGAYSYSYFIKRPVADINLPLEQIPGVVVVPPENDDEELGVDLPEIEGIEVVLTVSEEPGTRCWIEARSDGEVSFSGTLKQGETVTFKADEKLQVKVGNAGVVSILYNGKDLGSLGPKNKVMTLEFPPELLNE